MEGVMGVEWSSWRRGWPAVEQRKARRPCSATAARDSSRRGKERTYHGDADSCTSRQRKGMIEQAPRRSRRKAPTGQPLGALSLSCFFSPSLAFPLNLPNPPPAAQLLPLSSPSSTVHSHNAFPGERLAPQPRHPHPHLQKRINGRALLVAYGGVPAKLSRPQRSGMLGLR
uniref:Uncharacterized protein n=1 Tax=Oryza punctata TaxID=4537 RepID=A0A0E0K6C0_ORYPU